MSIGFFELLGKYKQYEGFVATRAGPLSTADAAFTQYMSRSAHIATDNLTSIKAVFTNFAPSPSTGDTGLGSTATITASFEYPAGTFTQIKFGGVASASVASGDLVFSDYATLSTPIPAGATFWVNEFFVNSGGVFYNTWSNVGLGEVFRSGTGSLTDLTMTGGFVSNSPGYSRCPLAIIGHTGAPSVVIVGDSIGFGTHDTGLTGTAFDWQVGSIARSMGSRPFVNLSIGSETANGWVGRSASKKQVIPYASHLICALGTNDFFLNDSTVAILKSDLQTIYALARPGQKIYQTTITPNTLSANGWVSPDDQTQKDVGHSPRVETFNADLRSALFTNLTGMYDVASVLELTADRVAGQFTPWIVGASPYAFDGLHPSPLGYAFIASSNIIDPTTIVWP
jgi:lysophospholipase L1-like esterase